MSEKVSARLKPCPFCGKRAEATSDAAGFWMVWCSDDECCHFHGNFESWMEAVARWNKRAPLTISTDAYNADYGSNPALSRSQEGK